MGQEDGSKKGRGGKHFTFEQRVRMDALIRARWPRGKKVNFAELGRLMGKARTTVRREYARGGVVNKDSQERWFNTYSAEAGRQHANARGHKPESQSFFVGFTLSAISMWSAFSTMRGMFSASHWRNIGRKRSAVASSITGAGSPVAAGAAGAMGRTDAGSGGGGTATAG